MAIKMLAPSLLAADFARLKLDISKIQAAGAHYLHLDVMDGRFVPNISFGPPVIKSIRGVTDMTFDVHLMIERPDLYVDAFADAGADILNIHAESDCDAAEVVARVKQRGMRAAVTIKPATPAESLFGLLPELDMVLIMSVEPGFGGQAFMPETLKKAEALANRVAKENLLTNVEMDGGIDLSKVRDVISAGVNVVVAGSSVFRAPDTAQAVRDFYAVFKEMS